MIQLSKAYSNENKEDGDGISTNLISENEDQDNDEKVE